MTTQDKELERAFHRAWQALYDLWQLATEASREGLSNDLLEIILHLQKEQDVLLKR